MKKAIIAVLLLLGAAHAPCQNRTDDTHDLDREPAEAGSKLKYFGSVDEGVYKGSRPKSDADYRFLQSLHVKYIVDLQVLPFMTRSERRKAKQYGIILIPGIMNASRFRHRKSMLIGYWRSCMMNVIIRFMSTANLAATGQALSPRFIKCIF